MDLHEKIRSLPAGPGVYLFHNADGKVIYVGKAKNLRSRVRSYFLDAAQANAKTGSLMREAVDLEYILVDNEQEALALENNLIKQRKPRFNVLLRDDKTYPYVKLTLGDRYPKIQVTRRVRKDGAAYYGPFFPGNLAYRIADLVHRTFRICNCKLDLSRYHQRPCLQYYIHRCLGPCVEGLTTPDMYAEAVRDTRLMLEGHAAELEKSLEQRMRAAADAEQFETAARYRDYAITLRQLCEKQRMAATTDDDADVLGYHYENGMLAVNLFHIRNGHIVDRREFFWEDLPEFLETQMANSSATETENDSHSPHPAPTASLAANETFSPAVFFSALLKQLYIDQQYVPRNIYVPVDFADRIPLTELLSSHTAHKVEIAVPQRGEKRSLLDLAGQNAKQSYDQRFRVLQPSIRAIQEALQDALNLPDLPERIECFDISHIQPMPSLILIDGGLGQLHAAAAALEEMICTTQPLAAIAKREEVIYVYGQEDEPVVLDRHSPVLHLVQRIRDESHRFAITYHRKRREMRDRDSDLLHIPGVGAQTRTRLITHFGSLRAIQAASLEALQSVVSRKVAESICEHFHPSLPSPLADE